MLETKTILIADDSENDLLLLRTAMKKSAFDFPMQEVVNGEQAIEYLSGAGIYQDRSKYPLPAVLLLDLNMPMKNGFEVLAWTRSQPNLKRLAIFVMTTSMRPQDVARSIDAGANAFLVKPSSMEGLTALTRCLKEWVILNHFAPLSA